MKVIKAVIVIDTDDHKIHVIQVVHVNQNCDTENSGRKRGSF